MSNCFAATYFNKPQCLLFSFFGCIVYFTGCVVCRAFAHLTPQDTGQYGPQAYQGKSCTYSSGWISKWGGIAPSQPGTGISSLGAALAHCICQCSWWKPHWHWGYQKEGTSLGSKLTCLLWKVVVGFYARLSLGIGGGRVWPFVITVGVLGCRYCDLRPTVPTPHGCSCNQG